MPLHLVAMWAAGGVLAAAAFARQTRLHITSVPNGIPLASHAASLTTGIVFGVLACRIGAQPELLAYSYLAAAGVAASIVDLVEHRLPSDIVLPAYLVLAVLLATSAIVRSDPHSFLRGLAASATLTTAYLILALASRGDLGAGDIRFGGLLGLALGWLSWSALATATLLGWLAAASAVALRRAARQTQSGGPLPMGPFLLIGALTTITTASW